MKIKGFYAIEISGVCNLKCDYCPYRLGQRERGLMDWQTLKQIFSWLEHERLGLDGVLHLHLFGEPLMHPEFTDMALWIHKLLPEQKLSFSTNCTLVTPEWANRLAMVPWEWITLSPHSPNDVAKAAISLQARGIKTKQQEGPDHNWAGQVEHPCIWSIPCEFGKFGKVVVRWNGDVALCCITDSEKGVIGTVWDDDLAGQEHRRFELCDNCHLHYGDLEDARKRRMVGDVVGMRTLPIRQTGT